MLIIELFLESGPCLLLNKGSDALFGYLDRWLDSICPKDPDRAKQQRTREFLAYERSAIFALLCATFFLRIVFALRYQIDSDEPQHLHVVWGWANGLLQYRDIFDNHTPLFHMLFWPLLSAIGERPDILFFMRLAMIPLYAVALWITYYLGRAVFSKRAGAWAAVLGGLFPAFFLTSVEFRTDDLWTVFWLLSVALLVSGSLNVKRSIVAGILFGAAAAVSLKTTLLLASLASSSLVVLAIKVSRRPQGERFFSRRDCLCLPAFLMGSALIPLSLTLFFISQGAFASFFYGTVQHNMVEGLYGEENSRLYWLLFAACSLFLWQGSRAILRCSLCEKSALRRVFIFLITGIYLSALVCFWPIVTVQDFLPVCPLAFVLLTPLIVDSHPFRRFRVFSSFLDGGRGRFLITFALFEIALLLVVGTPWRDNTSDQFNLIKDALALTQPSDYVLDLKGEMVFRRRSFYYALETITNEKIRRGLITDEIPERMIATRTFVAPLDNEIFSPRTRKFLKTNYLPVGTLRVAGQFLPDPEKEGSPISFSIVIPGRYAIIADGSEVRGLLDGISYEGPRVLTTGLHEFIPLQPQKGLALVWARAVEKGFSPFRMGSYVQ